MRKFNNSSIPLDVPSTRHYPKVSEEEKKIRPIVSKLFPNVPILYNIFPKILENPKTGRRFEADILIPRWGLIIDYQDKNSHYGWLKRKRDIKKRVIANYRGADIIQVPHNVDPELYIWQEWLKILDKRLRV